MRTPTATLRGARIQYHSFSLLAAPHKPINRFLWRPPTLWWVIKAYLHSVPLKGSEAPERRRVWSDISVPLHSLPCCHDLSYTIKKSKNMGIKPVPPPWSCLTYMWTTTATSVWSVNLPYLVVYSNCQFIFKTAWCVITYSTQWRSNKKTVIPTCWISRDHVSITQPLLGAHLRSSEKDKGWGNEMIQRGAHSRVDRKVDKKLKKSDVI